MTDQDFFYNDLYNRYQYQSCYDNVNSHCAEADLTYLDISQSCGRTVDAADPTLSRDLSHAQHQPPPSYEEHMQMRAAGACANYQELSPMSFDFLTYDVDPSCMQQQQHHVTSNGGISWPASKHDVDSHLSDVMQLIASDTARLRGKPDDMINILNFVCMCVCVCVLSLIHI